MLRDISKITTLLQKQSVFSEPIRELIVSSIKKLVIPAQAVIQEDLSFFWIPETGICQMPNKAPIVANSFQFPE